MTEARMTLAAGVLLLALAIPAQAQAGNRIPVDLQFYDIEAGDQPPMKRGGIGNLYRAFGKVVGPKKCARDRKVTLFYRPEEGKPRKVVGGYSDTLGYWSIHIPESRFLAGTYFAKAAKKKVGKAVCKADRSNAILFV